MTMDFSKILSISGKPGLHKMVGESIHFPQHFNSDDPYSNDQLNERETFEALNELLHYEYKNKRELGKALKRFNGAICVDILRDSTKKLIKTPLNHLILLRQLSREIYQHPSYGLKLGQGNRKKKFIHYLFEHDENSTTGVCYYDQNRPLTVKQIHECEKSTKSAGLEQTILVANKIGIPAKNEAKRINSEHGGNIIKLEHFNSLKMRYLKNL